LFIDTMDIVPLISLNDIISINKLILMLEIIGQCDVKHIMTLPIETKMSLLKVSINSHYH